MGWKYHSKKSFKPYYKWITFNTMILKILDVLLTSFKPYYKWITFNTVVVVEDNVNKITKF